MNAELTKLKDIAELRGWLLYDGDCPFCAGWAARLEKVLTRRGFDLAPLQSPWVRECLDLPVTEPFTELRVLTVDGRAFGGADAVVELARTLWWAWPLVAASLLPGARPLLRAGYRWLAARRHCRGQTCDRHQPARPSPELNL